MTATVAGAAARTARAGGAARAAAPRYFYVWMSVACMVIAVLGFMPTYFLPLAEGAFRGEPLIHIHGLILFSWLLFFFVQSLLAARGKVLAHRTWGVLGVALYTAMVFVMVAVLSMRIAQAQLPGQPAGLGHAMRAFEWLNISGLLIGIPTFILAIVYVKRPEIHKRLMLLVTIGGMGAPIARWFLFFLAPHADPHAPPWPAGLPHVTAPPVFFAIPPVLVADLLLVAAIIYDWRTRGRPHPVYLWSGAIGLLSLVTLAPVAESPAWQWFAAGLGHLAG
jgi:hypothetical protein